MRSKVKRCLKLNSGFTRNGVQVLLIRITKFNYVVLCRFILGHFTRERHVLARMSHLDRNYATQKTGVKLFKSQVRLLVYVDILHHEGRAFIEAPWFRR